MAVFNPKMLDASIRDVVSSLSNESKTSVLLYAMERLPPGPSSRTVIENAVQSCIQVSSTHPEKVAQARLLRAKARFSVGLRGAAHQDLQAILMIEPNHREARALMPPSGKLLGGEASSRAQGQPRFSNEIWREVALYLPRRDLLTLLVVPHALSAIASQLLFRKVHLQFGTATFYVKASGGGEAVENAVEIDKWHAQRSADILSRLVSDATYASLVRTFIVSAPDRGRNTLTAFQIAMLSNVLPRLINLEAFGCTMGNQAIMPLLQILETHHPKLRSLILDSTAFTPPSLPSLSHLTRFVYNGVAEEMPNLQTFFLGRTVALHTLSIHNAGKGYPAGIVSLSNLTVLELSVKFENANVLSDLLTHSQQLKTLRLACNVDINCVLSSSFRAHAAALPSLSEFAFDLGLAPRHLPDPDLFPAIAEFVRQHPNLVTLSLLAAGRPHVGFDAAVWGILPALAQLRTLQIDVPYDLSPALSAWLIPRTVVALNLILPPNSDTTFLTQLWPGLPRELKVVALPLRLSQEIQNLIGSRLPSLRLLCMAGIYYTVMHKAEQVTELERWSTRRTMFYFDDYIEEIECEEVRGFQAYDRLRWHW
ncbi:hypothetical protein BV25DRAFT_1903028 [Artomyces pyxidatus]|uniref:Uncharacterized protein n=1 Tax=Artomyces pyxidatus TaxID=48021 RepID=A0ACB8SM53_9AGAM|nr:hypothetical protein BV25DRAFT_1903028 [Artomyces pyxidatus]